MKRTLNIIIILFTGIILSSCTGEEIARLPINKLSISDDNSIFKEASLNLKKDDKINIWSEMDIEYKGDVSLTFELAILKDGKPNGFLNIDPTEKNLTIGEMKTDIMGDVKWSFSGKNSSITIEEDGNYTFKAFLRATENTSLIINKAELVFKK